METWQSSRRWNERDPANAQSGGQESERKKTIKIPMQRFSNLKQVSSPWADSPGFVFVNVDVSAWWWSILWWWWRWSRWWWWSRCLHRIEAQRNGRWRHQFHQKSRHPRAPAFRLIKGGRIGLKRQWNIFWVILQDRMRYNQVTWQILFQGEHFLISSAKRRSLWSVTTLQRPPLLRSQPEGGFSLILRAWVDITSERDNLLVGYLVTL